MFRSTIPLTEVPFHHAIIPLLNLYRLTLSDSLLCVCVWGGGACVNSMNTCQLTDSHPQFSDEDDNDDEDDDDDDDDNFFDAVDEHTAEQYVYLPPEKSHRYCIWTEKTHTS